MQLSLRFEIESTIDGGIRTILGPNVVEHEILGFVALERRFLLSFFFGFRWHSKASNAFDLRVQDGGIIGTASWMSRY